MKEFEEEVQEVTPLKVAQDDVKSLNLPEEVINAVLNYLASKPYLEVYQLVQSIQTEAKPV